MSRPMPGVNVSNELVTRATLQDASAVPVFIGYTLSGVPEQMAPVSSWEAFQSTFCGKHSKETRAQLETSALYQSLRLYFDNGGGECYVLPTALLGGVGKDAAAIAVQLNTALTSSALTEDNAITLLCVPDIVLLEGAEALWGEVWQTMLTVSRARTGCFALLDLPSKPDAATLVLTEAQMSTDAEFGAAYWPHLECTYLLNDERAVVPPSGAVAAQVQRTDRERGVWKAPANEALQQVIKPQYTPHEGDAVFGPNVPPVNLIRSFPGRGVRVWGCQTLTTSLTSPWRYLQIRRLLSYVEARLSALARFCVFEPNNEITWLKLKSLCRSWLRSLWLDGALYGASEDEAFRLYVGVGESMTAAEQQTGQLILRVELSALYPAEYINLSLRLTTMEASMDKELA